MAILEARLLPLIETLAEAGADWLAFEVVDGIRAGRVAEEHLEMSSSMMQPSLLERLARGCRAMS